MEIGLRAFHSSYSQSVDSKSKPDHETLAQYEIPQALLQIILAYSHNQHLEQYTGFVITMDRTVVRVGKAVVSQSYLRRLCAREPVVEYLLYYRSAPFELLEREGRREFLRVMFGVLRCLSESDASKMAIDHVSIFWARQEFVDWHCCYSNSNGLYVRSPA